MKKLLLTIGSISLFVPCTSLLSSYYVNNLESFSSSLTDVNDIYDNTINHFEKSNVANGFSFSAIETVSIGYGESKQEITVALTSDNSKIYVIQTDEKGNSFPFLLFTADSGYYITSFFGRQNILSVVCNNADKNNMFNYTHGKIVTFNFYSKSDIILNNPDVKWFDKDYKFSDLSSNNEDKNFVNIYDIKSRFDAINNSDLANVYFSPKSNCVLVNFLQDEKPNLYNIDSITGEFKKSNYNFYALKNIGFDFSVNSVFKASLDGEEEGTYICLYNRTDECYMIADIREGQFRKLKIKFESDTVVDAKDEEPFFYSLNNYNLMSYKGKVVQFKDDTTSVKKGNDDITINFTVADLQLDIASKNSEFNQTVFSYLITDPQGNYGIIMSTPKAQYMLKTEVKNGNSKSAGSKTFLSKNKFYESNIFTKIERLSNINVQYNQSINLNLVVQNGLAFILSGNGSLSIMQNKINLNLNADELSLSTDAMNSAGDDILKKIAVIRDTIAGSASQSFASNSSVHDYVSITEVACLLRNQYGRNWENELNNFKYVDKVQNSIKLSAPSNSWWNGSSLELTVGRDGTLDDIVNYLKGKQIDFKGKFFNDKIDYSKEVNKLISVYSGDLLKGGSISCELVNYTDGSGKKINYPLISPGVSNANLKLTYKNKEEKSSTDNVTIKVTGVGLPSVHAKSDFTVNSKKPYVLKIENMEDAKKYISYTGKKASIITTIDVTPHPNKKDQENESDSSNKKVASEGDDTFNWEDYFSITTNDDDGTVTINKTDNKYDGYIEVKLNIKVQGGGEDILLPTQINFDIKNIPPTNWALIGGSIGGGVAGAGILAFIIFAFIKWWYPALAAAAASARGSRAYKRSAAKKSKAVKANKAKKMNISAATTSASSTLPVMPITSEDMKNLAKKTVNEDDFIRNGLLEREIKSNKAKFKKPSREKFFIDNDEGVVNNWTTFKSKEFPKHPKIAFEKKTKVEEHNKEVRKKIEAKKAQIKDKKDKN